MLAMPEIHHIKHLREKKGYRFPKLSAGRDLTGEQFGWILL